MRTAMLYLSVLTIKINTRHQNRIQCVSKLNAKISGMNFSYRETKEKKKKDDTLGREMYTSYRVVQACNY
jgi:hypothetical protein